MEIDDSFVRVWSERYLSGQPPAASQLETELFETVGRGVAERGFYDIDDLLLVGKWKSPRVLSRLAANDPTVVEQITRAALSQPDERASTLDALNGVAMPMASALLTVWDPERYTVYDIRAVGTLVEAGIFEPLRTYPTFGLYLNVCRQLVHNLSLPDDLRPPLRALDRALWKYSEQTGETRVGEKSPAS